VQQGSHGVTVGHGVQVAGEDDGMAGIVDEQLVELLRLSQAQGTVAPMIEMRADKQQHRAGLARANANGEGRSRLGASVVAELVGSALQDGPAR